MTRAAEIKFTGFLVEHNLPLAAADHLGYLIPTSFPDSKIAQGYYSNEKSKASCVLNSVFKLDLHANFTKLMQNSYFSLATDRSNENMNAVTARIFYINQHKVVTQFFLCVFQNLHQRRGKVIAFKQVN